VKQFTFVYGVLRDGADGYVFQNGLPNALEVVNEPLSLLGGAAIRNAIDRQVEIKLENLLKHLFERSPRPECYVTLSQMAAIVNRSKRTVERLAAKDSFPLPEVEGGGGKPNEWRWSVVRNALEMEYGRTLPEVFPADRFVQ
jgi:hypothetical protein